MIAPGTVFPRPSFDLGKQTEKPPAMRIARPLAVLGLLALGLAACKDEKKDAPPPPPPPAGNTMAPTQPSAPPPPAPGTPPANKPAGQ